MEGAAESLVGYKGKTSAPGPQAEGNRRLSRIQRIRETAHTAARNVVTLLTCSNNEENFTFPTMGRWILSRMKTEKEDG